MASVDKVKVGSTSYDISPSKDGTLNGFTSNDAASPTAWSAANAITTSDTNSTIFSKITTMIKNVRWLYSKLGTTDFSATGQSTVTGALSALQTGLNGKAASSHSHTTAQLPVSSSQTNSNSYIPTSALVYSMQQKINSLNDAIANAGGTKIKYIDTQTNVTLSIENVLGGNIKDDLGKPLYSLIMVQYQKIYKIFYLMNSDTSDPIIDYSGGINIRVFYF